MNESRVIQRNKPVGMGYTVIKSSNQVYNWPVVLDEARIFLYYDILKFLFKQNNVQVWYISFINDIKKVTIIKSYILYWLYYIPLHCHAQITLIYSTVLHPA